MDSPGIKTILRRIDNALLNISEKEPCDAKFVELTIKLRELKNYIISCKCLPSFKASILLTLCTYIQAISTRHNDPSMRLIVNGVDAVPGPTKKIVAFEDQDEVSTLKDTASITSKKKKKSLMAKVSKKMKKIKRVRRVRKEEKHGAESSEIVKIALPVQFSKMINPVRFQQIAAMIDILTSEKLTYNHSVMLLREMDFILTDLKREEVSKGWFIRIFSEESKLLRFLRPTVKNQWQPILTWVKRLLFPIVIPLVCYAYTKFHNGENLMNTLFATLFLCLLDAPILVPVLARNKDPSQQIVIDSVFILLLWLMVKYFTSAAFVLFTLLLFSDVSCKQIAYFFILMLEKLIAMLGAQGLLCVMLFLLTF